MASREALAACLDHKTLLIAYERVICRQTLGGAAQFLRAQMSQEFGCFRPVPHLWLVIVLTVPRAQKKKTNALQVPLPRRLSWPCDSNLQSIYKAESWQRAVTLDDS